MLEGVLQGVLSVIHWFWCYIIMGKNTCHLLPIFREGEGWWEWALQGRLELSLDLTHPTPPISIPY